MDETNAGFNNNKNNSNNKNNNNNKLFSPLLTGVSAVKTPVSRSRYPPAQFVRL